MDQAYRAGTTAILALMCFLAVGMLFGLVTFSPNADRTMVIRFLAVASFPFVWTAVVLVSRRRQVATPVLFGLSAVALLAFIGAVDFANGRELYSGAAIFWKV